MKLWHCNGSRSLRPLWALEEMGLDYEVEVLPFPPRVFQRDYLEVNSLGTVPRLLTPRYSRWKIRGGKGNISTS